MKILKIINYIAMFVFGVILITGIIDMFSGSTSLIANIIVVVIILLIIKLNNYLNKRIFEKEQIEIRLNRELEHTYSQSKSISKPVEKTKQKPTYYKKRLLTEIERYFYEIIANSFDGDFLVVPQINLASIIEKRKDFKNQYQNELYRNIDFAIINKETLLTELLIEINDRSHNEYRRIKRDKKVKEICENANINLITFYTNMPNKKEYIVNRITTELEKKDS